MPDVSVMLLDGNESIVEAAIDIIVTYGVVNHGSGSDPIALRRWTAFKLFDTANSIVKSLTPKKK